MEEKQKVKKDIKIGYLGDVNSVFSKTLINNLNKNSNNLYNYILKDIQKFSDIDHFNEINSSIVLIDRNYLNFSIIKLIKYFKQTYINKKLICIGLIKEISDDIVQNCIEEGCSFIYKKSTASDEIDILSKNIIKIFNPQVPNMDTYAVALIEKDNFLKSKANISLISKNKIIIDSDFSYNDLEKEIHIDFKLIKELNISKNLTLKNCGEPFIHLNRNFSMSFDFSLVNKYDFENILSELNRVYTEDFAEEKKNELNKKIKNLYMNERFPVYEKLYKKQMMFSPYKDKNNVCIISKNVKNINLKGASNENFYLSKQTNLDKKEDLYRKFKSKIIFYEMEELPIDPDGKQIDVAYDYNNLKSLQILISRIKDDLFYKKIKLIVFNCEQDPEEMKAILGYKDIVFTQNPINEDVISSYLQKLKFNKKVNKDKETESLLNKEVKFNFDSKESLIDVEVPCILEKLTENSLIVKYKGDLPYFKPFEIFLGEDLLVTFVPESSVERKLDGYNYYYGIINKLDEIKRNDLRALVITYTEDQAPMEGEI